MMHYFLFEAQPSPDSANPEDAGGAYISCWIRCESAESARIIAQRRIEEDGWCSLMLLEYDLPERSWYENTPDSLDAFDFAQKHGEDYIFHLWPIEPRDGQSAH